MKKIIIFLSIILILPIILSAEKINDDMKNIFTFKDIDIHTLIDETGSHIRIICDQDNNFYINDTTTGNIRVYNNHFQFQRIINIKSLTYMGYVSRKIYSIDGNLYYLGGKEVLILIKDNKNYLYLIQFELGEYTDNFLIVNDILITERKSDGQYEGWRLPANPNGKAQKINEEEIFQYLKSIKINSPSITFDEKNIYYNNKIFGKSRNYKEKNYKIYTLLSCDRDNNTFHSGGYIFDKNGNLLEKITITNPDYQILYSSPFMDYDGNIYVYSSTNAKDTSFYYIGRDWGYEKTGKGVIKNNPATIYLYPDAGSVKIGELPNGTGVIILDKAKDRSEDTLSRNWVRVKSNDGLIGWCPAEDVEEE